ncbi:MAG: hypothetical protein U5M23_06150 [Marinagarivorans sp.]|nr:hypothetical protein [Marinagarivorans sp.]
MRIDFESLTKAIKAFEIMTLKEKGKVVDRIYLSQPNLLASILALKKFGCSIEHIDEVLRILIVIFLALEFSMVKIATVPELEQERELSRLIGIMKFSEGLTDSLTSKSIQNYIENHKEKIAFAYVINLLNESGISSLKERKLKISYDGWIEILLIVLRMQKKILTSRCSTTPALRACVGQFLNAFFALASPILRKKSSLKPAAELGIRQK